jgi:4-hydroxybenzoate polyprenyltransferase
MGDRVWRAVRLVHPFPSLLDGAVVALVALVAGAATGTALLLGLSMSLLQFAIGTLNDIVDAPADAGLKPGKPIPEHIVPLWAAWVVAGTCSALGLTLSLIGGPWLLLLAITVLVIGAWYDLRAKGSSLSWLPIAIGIPLLPVYGWYGATGSLPALFVVLIPAAANAGTALAIANSAVDVERDTQAHRQSIALALGPHRAALVGLAMHVVVVTLAIGTALVLGVPAGWTIAVVLVSGAPLTGGVLGLIAARRRGGTELRELAWEIQAVGTGLLAVAWLGALSAAERQLGG